MIQQYEGDIPPFFVDTYWNKSGAGNVRSDFQVAGADAVAPTIVVVENGVRLKEPKVVRYRPGQDQQLQDHWW